MRIVSVADRDRASLSTEALPIEPLLSRFSQQGILDHQIEGERP